MTRQSKRFARSRSRMVPGRSILVLLLMATAFGIGSLSDPTQPPRNGEYGPEYLVVGYAHWSLYVFPNGAGTVYLPGPAPRGSYLDVGTFDYQQAAGRLREHALTDSGPWVAWRWHMMFEESRPYSPKDPNCVQELFRKAHAAVRQGRDQPTDDLRQTILEAWGIAWAERTPMP